MIAVQQVPTPSLPIEEPILNDTYLLPRGGSEPERLMEQYNWIKKVMGRGSPLPPSIDPATITHVMDVAAGSLLWTLDVANMPEIKPRLVTSSSPSTSTGTSTPTPKPVKLYACDLSTSQYPAQSILDEYGITAFQHDATTPFPDEFKGKFDVVNMRLINVAISRQGWQKALTYVREILKPGGKLILVEFNLIWYHPDREYPTDWHEDPEEPYDQDVWVDELNYILRKATPSTGQVNYIRDPVYHLPHYVMSSWNIDTRQIFQAPVGILCRTIPGAQGQSYVTDEEFTTRNFFFIFDQFTANFMKLGRPLEARDGRRYETEEARRGFMRWVLGRMKESGARATFTEMVISKPYEFVGKPTSLTLLGVPEKMQTGVGAPITISSSSSQTPTPTASQFAGGHSHSRSSSATAWEILVQLQKSVAKAIRLG